MLSMQTDDLDSRKATALRMLYFAHDEATATGTPEWQLAVGMSKMRTIGIEPADLRWLCCHRYIQHAIEVTAAGDESRSFRATTSLSFFDRSCFMVTSAGVAFSREHAEEVFGEQDRRGPGKPAPVAPSRSATVEWDLGCRELRVDGGVVRRYRRKAESQWSILNAFQSRAWARSIGNPLDARPTRGRGQRLREVVSDLNQNHLVRRICFHCDNDGQRVWYDIVDGAARQAPEL